MLFVCIYDILKVPYFAVGAVCKCRWSDSTPGIDPEEFLFVILRVVRMFYTRYPKEESIMDYLNLVFSALTLLATVTLGVIQITWMIARDVFRDKHKARHDSWDKK